MNEQERTALRRRIDHILSQHGWADPSEYYCLCGLWVSDMDSHRARAVETAVSELLTAKDDSLQEMNRRFNTIGRIHYPENDKWGGISCASCRVSYPCDTSKATRGEGVDNDSLSPHADENVRINQALADIQSDMLEYEKDILRLTEENDRLRSAWRSARERARTAKSAWKYQNWVISTHDEEIRKQDDFARFLWNTMAERRQERDRYRNAWLSARKRIRPTNRITEGEEN